MTQNANPETTATRVLDVYDATPLVGLRTVVRGAAIERSEAGEITVELPRLAALLASAAVARCLMPIRLRGGEITALRKIMGLTQAELARDFGTHTAPETVSRWESEAQPMGGYAEKVFRLLVCEALGEDAPGIGYRAEMIAHLQVVDPWRAEPEYEVPAIELSLIKMKTDGAVIDAWDRMAA